MRIGVDIGGTKCAVVLGDENGVAEKIKFNTEDCKNTLERIFDAVGAIGKGDSIGVSSGGPLDERRGVIMSPPNLPGWDNIPITEMLSDKFGVPAYLCNDANASALAEWRYGAGQGTDNMVFLTFGTGLGAGIIMNGGLISGFSGMAGELGHVRLSDSGPIGYGKAGSVEGFCSGSGIRQLGIQMAKEALLRGENMPYCCKSEDDLSSINAKILADAARLGDRTALEVYRISGEALGRALAIVVDLLNPERIIIGSIFTRAEDLLRPHMERTLSCEALSLSLSACKILPSGLGEEIGDYAALSVAYLGDK